MWSARLNADATRAATGSADFTVKVWDAIAGTVLATLEHGHVVRSVDFSSDGARLATGGQDKKLRVFDMAALDAPPAVVIECPERIRKVAWSRDDARVYTGSDDGAVRAYAVGGGGGGGALVAEAHLHAGGGVADLELSPDGATLTVAAAREVLLLDAASLAVRARHRLPYTVEAASLHPGGGKRFVAGGSDVHVHVHDADSGAELACHKGHHGTVHCVRFAPDGETYASGASDAIIRIWRLDV